MGLKSSRKIHLFKQPLHHAMKAAKFFVFGFLRGLRDGPEQDKRCARQKYKDGFQKTFGRVHGEL